MAISDQMEMAFNEQAPQVDPVSGNEVPPGSLPEEVRDDIDARLSEGEYVVPADVVRFFGVKYFEDLRTEAKLGLSGMESDGRIGGEPMAVDPSGMPPEGMDISEEDIAALEQALTTGVANGGLMDKMATAAKNDPLINSRMNAGGLIVGFAEGGAASSLYDDPTRIDSLIQKVTAAAQSNPTLMGELAKRGVSVNTTQANMDPNAMQQANNQVQTFVEGGAVASTFNPASYPLGFSAFGPTAPGMEGVTTQVAYYNPTTGENRSFAHYTSTNTPAETIPSGFIMGAAPAKSMAGVNAGIPSGQVIDISTAPGGDVDQNRQMQALMDTDTDPDSWVKKYDYSDPGALTKTLMDSIDDDTTFIQERLAQGTIPGFIANAIYLDKARQVNTNIEWLRSINKNGEADRLKAQLEIYKDQRNIKGDITGGSYSIDSIIENGNVSPTVGKGVDTVKAAENARINKENAAMAARQKAAADEMANRSVSQRQVASSYQADRNESNNVSMGQGTAAQVQASRDRAAANTAAVNSASKMTGGVTKENVEKSGGTWASGGRAKGGLMKKKK